MLLTSEKNDCISDVYTSDYLTSSKTEIKKNGHCSTQNGSIASVRQGMVAKVGPLPVMDHYCNFNCGGNLHCLIGNVGCQDSKLDNAITSCVTTSRGCSQ